MEALLRTIKKMVNSKQGVNGVELILDVMGEVGPTRLDKDEYNQCLQSLVDTGELVKIDYILPQLEYRIKSMYFPKGTVIIVNVKDDRTTPAIKKEWGKE